ncbi:MAG: bacteriohopanetetrol glucosamine biosynthesis glycosyltransferase HpnI [Caulobacteraceae bacterium]
MNHVLPELGWLASGIAILGSVYAVAAALLVRRFFHRAERVATELPSVTVLKPLHGDEPWLRTHLEAFCTQDYPAPVQLVFGVQDPFDPAIEVVRDLQRRWPDLDIELVIDERIYGLNRKVSNLVNMEPRIRHPVVVMADDDIGVEPNYLTRVVSALAPAEVGFVTCAYVGKALGGVWSDVSAMAVNYHFLPSVAVGMALKLARPCFGATIAFPRSTLEEIGGFLPFANQLADDYEIGRAIAAVRPGFAVPPLVVTHACPDAGLGDVVSHELRWAKTIRTIDPAGFAGSAVTHALPWAIIGGLIVGGVDGAAIVCTAFAARIFLQVQVDRATGFSAGAWWLIPLRDVLSFTLFATTFLTRSVKWRGIHLQVGGDGVLLSQPRV